MLAVLALEWVHLQTGFRFLHRACEWLCETFACNKSVAVWFQAAGEGKRGAYAGVQEGVTYHSPPPILYKASCE